MFFGAIAFALLFGPGIVRRHRRRRNGRCEDCGYDLRGSDDSSVCPKCGASAGKPAG
jgi:rubrerythrin